jgi:preprotein translocase subunit SecA
LPVADDEAIQNRVLSNLIEEAQKKIEGQNYDVRKHVTEYDDVINRQRTVVYARRNQVLKGDKDFVWEDSIESAIDGSVYLSVQEALTESPKSKKFNDKLEVLSDQLNQIVKLDDFSAERLGELLKLHKYKPEKITPLLTNKTITTLKDRWKVYTIEEKSGMVRYLSLRSIDVLWTEHLVSIDHLSDSVRMRGYSQKDPLVEFKQDGMTIFMSLLNEIDRETAYTAFRVTPDMVPKALLG